MPSTILKNLTHCWYDLRNGVKSLIRWLPIIWFDRDWDWSYLAKLIEVKCTRIAKVMENGYHENGNLAATQLCEVARLIRRVVQDEYLGEISGPIITNAEWIESPNYPGYTEYHCEHFRPDGSKVSQEEYFGWVKAANQARNQELRVAMQIISNHLLEWWD